jgi:CRISPR-associated protein Csx16
MRLISFLGTGNYGETTYSFESSTYRTRYVAHALASFTRPNEIRLIATAEAWNQHGDALAQGLSDSGHPVPEQVRVPTGGEPQQLWQMFGTIVEVIRTSGNPVLLDITHGFRMQPFFAAACIQYVQSVLPNPPQIRVVYGEYRGADQESPIWELTPFLEVLSWSRNLMMFLQTGQADDVVAPTEALGRELSRQWAMTGRQGTQPQLRALAQALSAFGDDFTTIRTGSLLIGRQPSAQRLWEAIERTSDEVAQRLPALALVLDQVRAMVEPEQGCLPPTANESFLLWPDCIRSWDATAKRFPSFAKDGSRSARPRTPINPVRMNSTTSGEACKSMSGGCGRGPLVA